LLGLPGWFLFFLGGGAAAPGAAVEFCCREEEPACGCICVSPSPKKGADEAAAIGRKENTDRPPQLLWRTRSISRRRLLRDWQLPPSVVGLY